MLQAAQPSARSAQLVIVVGSDSARIAVPWAPAGTTQVSKVACPACAELRGGRQRWTTSKLSKLLLVPRRPDL